MTSQIHQSEPRIITFSAAEFDARPLAHRFFSSYACLCKTHHECPCPATCGCGCHREAAASVGER